MHQLQQWVLTEAAPTRVKTLPPRSNSPTPLMSSGNTAAMF